MLVFANEMGAGMLTFIGPGPFEEYGFFTDGEFTSGVALVPTIIIFVEVIGIFVDMPAMFVGAGKLFVNRGMELVNNGGEFVNARVDEKDEDEIP